MALITCDAGCSLAVSAYSFHSSGSKCTLSSATNRTVSCSCRDSRERRRSRTVEVRGNVETAGLVRRHGLRHGEKTGRERADAELFEIFAGDDRLRGRRDFDTHAGPILQTEIDMEISVEVTDADLGMPLASKSETSFFA